MLKHFIAVMAVISLCGANSYAQKPVQTIRGTIKDVHTQEALIGAHIVLTPDHSGTIADAEGRFKITGVPVGRYNLEAGYMGYEPVIIPELLVGSGKEVVLEIALEPVISELEEVVIKSLARKDRPINSMAHVSARTFSVEEAGRYAGALDDPGRMAGNFAGVTTVGVHVNAIVVRGNAPKGMLWRLEGVDIPVPSHFSGSNVMGGGGLTMFSSHLLANSDFYTGAFPAEYDQATAGVFDMKLRKGNNRKHEYAFQIGVQGIEAAAEGPFSQNSDGSFLINYRYSTMALVFPLLPETKFSGELPIYQDLSFKFHAPAGKAGIFSFWGIGGLSQSKMQGTDEIENWTYPENRIRMNFQYNMGTSGITHTKSLSTQTVIHSTIALNADEHVYNEKGRIYENNPSELAPLFNTQNSNGKATFSSLINHVVNSRLSLKSGGNVSRISYDLKGNARNIETETLQQTVAGSGNNWILSAHVQGKYQFNHGLSVTAGMNASWFELNREFRVEPRVAGSWQVNQQHRLSIGYGNHSQIEPLFVYYVTRLNNETGESEYPNSNLNRMVAHHVVMGYDWAPTTNLRFKMEPYIQFLNEVPVVDNSPYSMINFMSDWTFDKIIINAGTGKNIGIDLTAERFLKDGYYYMGTASVYKSTYTGGDGIERRTRYDGGYVLNLLGGKEWQLQQKNLLGLNVKFTVMGPYWYYPVNEEESHLVRDIIYDENQPFNDRYSDIETMTDLTASYRINGLKTSSIFKLQVKNIFGDHYRGKKYNLKTRGIENDFFSSPIPFVSYKLEF